MRYFDYMIGLNNFEKYEQFYFWLHMLEEYEFVTSNLQQLSGDVHIGPLFLCA